MADALAGATLPTLIFRGELDARANPYRAVRDAARALLGLRTGLETPLTVQLTDAVGRLAPHLSPLVPLVARLCHLNVPGTPESDAIDPQFVADRAADVMIELTRQLVPGPGVVVVEDAQWMDDASAHLLQRISGSARDYGWMMVVTRRPQGEGGFRPTGALEIELEPLDEVPATDLVIDATAATPLRPIDIAALVDRAAGNPLFLVALVSSLHDGGGTDLPDSLDAVMAAQIDSLAAVPRTVLRYASVLGTSASTKVLRTLLQDAGISLDDAARWDLRELLVADGPRRLRFKTVVLRDAAYASLSFRRRRQLHSRAATILAASARPDEVADRLALHHLRAQEYDQAWHFARIAGDRAQEAAANMAAALQYDHALEAAARLPHLATADLIDVWARLGDVLVAAGVFDGGLHAYTRAAQLARGEAQRTAELLMKRARAQERAGRFTAALRTTARIARLAEASGDAGGLAARALSFRCVIRCAQERPADTLRLARQAVVAARTCGDKESLAQALTMVDWAQRMLGVATTTANAEAALALYEELGDLNGQAMVHGNLGGERYFTGDWEAALEHYRRAEEASRKTGDTVQAAMADASIGEILVSQGRFDEALPLLIASARTMRASGFIDGAAFAEINIARLHLGRQQVAEAVEVLERVIAEVDALGLAASALEASMYRAECDVRLGQPAQALRRLTESKLRAGRRAEVFQAGLARVDALGLAGLGQTGLALDRLDQGIEIARAQGLVFELAQLLSERTRLAADRDPTQQAEALELLTRLRAEPPAHLLAI